MLTLLSAFNSIKEPLLDILNLLPLLLVTRLFFRATVMGG